jgi:hypothetical protein
MANQRWRDTVWLYECVTVWLCDYVTMRLQLMAIHFVASDCHVVFTFGWITGLQPTLSWKLFMCIDRAQLFINFKLLPRHDTIVVAIDVADPRLDAFVVEGTHSRIKVMFIELNTFYKFRILSTWKNKLGASLLSFPLATSFETIKCKRNKVIAIDLGRQEFVELASLLERSSELLELASLLSLWSWLACLSARPSCWSWRACWACWVSHLLHLLKL